MATTKRKECKRCNGKGYIDLYNYNGGLCYSCHGRGEHLTVEETAAEVKARDERNTHEQAETAVRAMAATWVTKSEAARALVWLGKLAQLDRAKAEALFKSLPEERQALVRAAKQD